MEVFHIVTTITVILISIAGSIILPLYFYKRSQNKPNPETTQPSETSSSADLSIKRSGKNKLIIKNSGNQTAYNITISANQIVRVTPNKIPSLEPGNEAMFIAVFALAQLAPVTISYETSDGHTYKISRVI